MNIRKCWLLILVCLSAFSANSFAVHTESYDLLFGINNEEVLAGTATLVSDRLPDDSSLFELHSELNNLLALNAPWNGSLYSLFSYQTIPNFLSHLNGKTVIDETILLSFLPFGAIDYTLSLTNGDIQLTMEITANTSPHYHTNQISLNAVSKNTATGAEEKFSQSYPSNLPLRSLRFFNIFPINRHQGYIHGKKTQQLSPVCWIPALFQQARALVGHYPGAAPLAGLFQNNDVTVLVSSGPFANEEYTKRYFFAPASPLRVSGLAQYFADEQSEFNGFFLGWQLTTGVLSLIYQVSAEEKQKIRGQMMQVKNSDASDNENSESESDGIANPKFLPDKATPSTKKSASKSTIVVGTTELALKGVEFACIYLLNFLWASYMTGKISIASELLNQMSCNALTCLLSR